MKLGLGLGLSKMIRTNSAAQLARRDTQRYAELIAAAGGAIVSAEQTKLRTFAESLYSLVGRSDFWSLRSAQNMGAGAVAYSFHGRAATLVNGPTWSAAGLSFPATSHLDTINLTPAGLWSAIVVMETAGSTANEGGLRFGANGINGNQLGFWYRSSDTRVNLSSIASGGGDRSILIAPHVIGLYTLRSPAAGTELVDYHCSIDGSAFVDFVGGTAGQSPTLGRMRVGIGYNETPLNQPHAFAALINRRLTDSEIAGIYAAYKASIGSGLSLA